VESPLSEMQDSIHDELDAAEQATSLRDPDVSSVQKRRKELLFEEDLHDSPDETGHMAVQSERSSPHAIGQSKSEEDVTRISPSNSEDGDVRRHVDLQQLRDALEDLEVSENKEQLPDFKSFGIAGLKTELDKATDELLGLMKEATDSVAGAGSLPRPRDGKPRTSRCRIQGVPVHKRTRVKAPQGNGSASASQYSLFVSEELMGMCHVLKLMCEDIIATHPNVSTSFLKLGALEPSNAGPCYNIAEVTFLLGAFASQLLVAIGNLMSSFSLSLSMDLKPEKLIIAIKKVSAVLQPLGVEIKAIHLKYLHRTDPDEDQEEDEGERVKMCGIEKQLETLFQQLDIGIEQLEMTHQKLQNFSLKDVRSSSEASKSPPRSEESFQKEGSKHQISGSILTIVQKLLSMEEMITSIRHVIRSEYKL